MRGQRRVELDPRQEIPTVHRPDWLQPGHRSLRDVGQRLPASISLAKQALQPLHEQGGLLQGNAPHPERLTELRGEVFTVKPDLHSLF